MQLVLFYSYKDNSLVYNYPRVTQFASKMAVFRGLMVLALCGVLCSCKRVRYDGFQVLRVTPKTQNETTFLRALEHSTLARELDFWTLPSHIGKSVDILVSPTLLKDLQRKLNGASLSFEIMIEDVQRLIDEEEKELNTNSFDYNKYNCYEMIQQWITDTANAHFIATEGTIGSSFEGRNIGYLKISKGGSKKAVVFHGGIHAREWITPATVMYLARYLIEGGAAADNLLNKFDFYVIPVMNPDGYNYTWTDNRFWRKTRSLNEGSECVGTDPNRNFATGWGGVGSSDDPCSDIYRGSEPFSEAETANLRDFITRLGGGGNVALYIDYHCYSQLWLSPYGYRETKPADYDQQFAGAEAAVTALKGVHSRTYIYGNVYDVIYPASGGALDYMYEGQGITFSYTPEGRDKGYYGFVLPDMYIKPSAEENWAAFQAICNYVYSAN